MGNRLLNAVFAIRLHIRFSTVYPAISATPLYMRLANRCSVKSLPRGRVV